ncbi:MAG: NAD(P)-dependent oxidoreductase [Thermoanaerobaculia bacterium]|nr:NAD(P)-dependent oxidoreductase [Thermoanaerobaculia bacterium]
MRLLLTGSNGFVGGRIAALALARGWEVVGVGRAETPGKVVSSYRRHDLSLSLDFTERVDAVVHCAALAAPWAAPRAFRAANVEATRNVLDWAARQGAPPFIYISSSSVFYRNADQLGLTEESPIPPAGEQINEYSRTKRIGEELTAAYPGSWAILRPRAVFGPGDTVLLPRIVEAARRGKLPVFTRRDGQAVQADLIYVDNVAHYTLEALVRAVSGAYNLTNGEPVSLYPFLFDLLARLGQPRPTRRLPVGVAMALAGLAEGVSALFLGYREPPVTRFGVSVFAYSKTFDVEKCRRDLGPPPVSLAEGVERVVAAWREAGGA